MIRLAVRLGLWRKSTSYTPLTCCFSSSALPFLSLMKFSSVPGSARTASLDVRDVIFLPCACTPPRPPLYSEILFGCLSWRCHGAPGATVGILNLVDLAGSERLKKSASEGQRKTEALHINSSLTALGKVWVAAAGRTQAWPRSYKHEERATC